ncbi:PucR family transcriptional regulator [Allosaccharopolyspora coralli]|uniref:PucR family transcriptional regulator n=1 Tax=Allosaccharopolyspora coralli TaxID=2665642 RepID=A0A5Q3Q3S8_9PSEU|nr:helix-turn-helix domain-containing protein [Allosaccharopolyspora coralli]QGK69092.1 PucR family transcriptional regulator [Allosaccharopolyspora coralli]
MAVDTERAGDEHRMLASLARTSLTRLPSLADELVDQVWGEPYDRDGPVTKDDLWRSCRDNISSILTTLHGAGPTASDLRQAARSTGVRRARQHCPLDWVLHAWQVGGHVLWSDLAERTGAADSEQLRELVRSASEVFRVTESYAAEMARSYQTHEQELRGSTDLRLMAVLDALIDGRAETVRVEAEQLLRLEGNRPFVVVTAETSSAQPLSPNRLNGFLADHGVSGAWRLRTGCQVGILTAEHATPAEVAAMLRRRTGGRVGVSPSLTNLGDVAAGHRMARLAMATLPADVPGAVALDDCLPDALLLNSPELADRMVSVTLGPVLALPAAERDELLGTTSVWLTSLGSTLRAAKLLYCHRNTVLKRLRRVESLTGLDLGDVEHWPQLLMALSVLRREGRIAVETPTPKALN